MPGGKNEAITIWPIWTSRGVAEVSRPEDECHRRHSHRRSRMTRIRLLNSVHREGADRVDGEALEPVRGDRHRSCKARWVLRAARLGCDSGRSRGWAIVVRCLGTAMHAACSGGARSHDAFDGRVLATIAECRLLAVAPLPSDQFARSSSATWSSM